jgi:hypothetical protein
VNRYYDNYTRNSESSLVRRCFRNFIAFLHRFEDSLSTYLNGRIHLVLTKDSESLEVRSS